MGCGFIGETESPYFHLIRAAWVPNAQRGGTVKPGERGENIVMAGETQGAYFSQTLFGFRIGLTVIAGDFTIHPNVGVRLFGKEEAAAVSILAELQRIFRRFPHRARGLASAEMIGAVIIFYAQHLYGGGVAEEGVVLVAGELFCREFPVAVEGVRTISWTFRR